MGKDITIVTFANRISLIKTFSGPGLKLKSFEIGKDFMTSEGAVFELKSLAEVLQRHHNLKGGNNVGQNPKNHVCKRTDKKSVQSHLSETIDLTEGMILVYRVDRTSNVSLMNHFFPSK